jgi:energy-converting hydrogenase Eha subunit H
MNPTKAAAILALVVTVIAAGYLCYALYENVILLKATNESLDCTDLRIESGTTDCSASNVALEYGISGGIAVVSLIASLALFGAAKPKT